MSVSICVTNYPNDSFVIFDRHKKGYQQMKMAITALFSFVVFMLLLSHGEAKVKREHRVIDYPSAVAAAKAVVALMSNTQKVTVLSGIGAGTQKPCVYVTKPVTVGSTTYPGLCFADGPSGIRAAVGISSFPAGINAAQTWDRDLIYQRANGIGAQFRGKGVNVALGPGMNLARAPLAGRNWEGFGADPYLSGEAAFATIQGIQDNGVIANAKHFIGNEQEHFRYSSSSNIDDRTLFEIYGWPFYKSVQAGVASIMCAFNLVNGNLACHSPYMNSILRNVYGFQGFIVSDYNAAKDTKVSINNGMDISQPEAFPFGQNLLNAIGNGVTQKTVDDAVVHVLTAYYALGQNQGYPPVAMNFANPYQAPVANVNTSAHAALIRKIGAESVVLLKNNKILPLSTSAGLKIGVFGTDSVMPTKANSVIDGTWLDGTVSQGYGSASVLWPYLVTPLDAIKRAFGSTKVTSVPNNWNLNSAKTTAGKVDIAIVCVNVNSGENYVSIDNNFGDRNNFSLWHNGDNLINAVASVNKKTIVVMHTTGQVNMLAWVNNPNVVAIVLAGLPGQESGNSLVDVLTGVVNPSGKLAYTIAKNNNEYPAQVVTSGSGTVQIDYKEKLLVDYRHFDNKTIQPLYPFGFGLSYTTFQYSNFAIVGSNQVGYGPGNETTVITAKVTITNNGTVAGKEVVQLYVAYPAVAGEPPRVLRGFEKVQLAAAASATVTFELKGIELSIWDTSSKSWQMVPGTYTLYAAASSRDLRLSTTLTITGSTAGRDIPGADLAGMPIVKSSAYECDLQCRATPACVGWSFAYSASSSCSVSNQCWLKSSVGTPTPHACRQYGVK